MDKFELREGADVFTARDEQLGKINAFVLNPVTNEVTHIIVQKGGLLTEDKVLPFDTVTSATEDKVVLNESIENFDELPAFEETHYIRTPEADVSRGGNPRYNTGQPSRLEEPGRDESIEADISRGGQPRSTSAPVYYWYPPRGYIGYPIEYSGLPPMETVQNIPENTISLKEGTDVMSSDGEHVGDVERLFVEPESNRATHFVISQGVLFKDRKLIPTHWVRSIGEDKIDLSVTSQVLEQLPSYEE